MLGGLRHQLLEARNAFDAGPEPGRQFFQLGAVVKGQDGQRATLWRAGGGAVQVLELFVFPQA